MESGVFTSGFLPTIVFKVSVTFLLFWLFCGLYVIFVAGFWPRWKELLASMVKHRTFEGLREWAILTYLNFMFLYGLLYCFETVISIWSRF